ncbi:MAG: preprotein translocase subunit SecA, partial [Caldilineaceae bacterium]|nr:preprotein translocase subunit SecA [Caldilineaceae bacterium]
MFRKILTAIMGDPSERELKRMRPTVEQINELEAEFERKSDEELKALTSEFRTRITDQTQSLREELAEAEHEYEAVAGTDEQRFARLEVERLQKDLLKLEEDLLNDVLPEAFAAVREASK